MRHLVEVGKISRPHGFKGDFLAQSIGGTQSALGYVKEVFVGRSPDAVTPYPVKESAWMPKGWKLRLEGIASDTEVKALQGALLYVDRSQLKPTQTDEYYVEDLIGALVVEHPSGAPLGTFAGIEPVGAESSPNVSIDRWWCDSENGSFAIPAIKRFIVKVDLNEKKIWVQNVEELRE